MSDEDKKEFPVGTIVWLPLTILSSGREFMDERDTPAADYNGYSLVMPGTVEFIEHIEKEIT